MYNKCDYQRFMTKLNHCEPSTDLQNYIEAVSNKYLIISF